MVEAVEAVVLIEGVGDAWALSVDESGDGVVVMLAEYMLIRDDGRGRRSYEDLSNKGWSAVADGLWRYDVAEI